MPVLPAGTKQTASASYLDAGGERGSFHILGTPITAGNAVAQASAWALVLTALDALVLGTRVRDTYNDETVYAASRPTNGAAREIALKVIFRDASTGQTWSALVPTLNIALIEYDPNYGAKDVVLLDTTEVADLITALNAFPVKSPYVYANSGTVIGAQVVRGYK